tara:strand:+ start:2818 stop:3135 length:318 start_codon:yes stop_codon:yes gene_type:complete
MDIIEFKHSRHNLIQSIFGRLEEDASLIAVEETEKKINVLLDKLEKAAEEDNNFGDSKAIEICCKEASTTEELVVFIHAVSSMSACPSHQFLQMIGMRKKGDSGE